jgi:hypothetical protein
MTHAKDFYKFLFFPIQATSLCFAEKSVYTQEVLAIVIQQLCEINPIPTLLMRSVIQTLATYSKLTGFVLNIMQRLITKQVKFLFLFSFTFFVTFQCFVDMIDLEVSESLGRLHQMLPAHEAIVLAALATATNTAT